MTSEEYDEVVAEAFEQEPALPETEIVANDEPDFEEYEAFVYDSERDGRRINLQEEA